MNFSRVEHSSRWTFLAVNFPRDELSSRSFDSSELTGRGLISRHTNICWINTQYYIGPQRILNTLLASVKIRRLFVIVLRARRILQFGNGSGVVGGCGHCRSCMVMLFTLSIDFFFVFLFFDAGFLRSLQRYGNQWHFIFISRQHIPLSSLVWFCTSKG